MKFAAAPTGPRRLVWLAAALIAEIATLALLLGLGSQPAHANPGAVENLAGCQGASLAANDDGSSDAYSLGFNANFFGHTYSQLYVNNNGNVTFDEPLSTYTAEPIQSTHNIVIAPFWADVDTQALGSNVVTYGQTFFAGHPAFCANWVDVGYFYAHDDKLNGFQLLIVDRSDTGAGDFDMIMNYDKVQWETGDVSGGDHGLGGSSARMGYSNGSDVSFEYPGSGVNGAFLDGSATGLSHNSRNSLINGRYVFEVRGGQPPSGGSVSGTITRNDTHQTLPGAIVALCTNICNTTNADSNGFYTFTGLPAGDYVLYAFPPNTDAPIRPFESDAFHVQYTDTITNEDAALEVAHLPPEGTTFSPQLNPNQAVPWIAWNSPTTMTEPGPPGLGSISADVKQNGVTIATFTLFETPPGSGSYTGTMPSLAPHHGWAQIVKHLPGGDEFIDIWVDPSGAVKTVGGDPIQGATVTLYRSDSAAGPFVVVPNGSSIMSVANRVNPGSTDVNGHFGWDVIAGFYKVRAEKSGCHEPANSSQAFVETDVLTIPPPVTDLDLRLDCGGATTTLIWGNSDCSVDGVTSRDSQAVLKNVLQKTPLSQDSGCPTVGASMTVGASVTVSGVARTWGNWDCSADGITSRDSQAVLKNVLQKTPLSQDTGCPAVGSMVTLGGGAGATSLAQAASAGQTEIQVASTAGFQVGDHIRINPGGANQEDDQVNGFGSLLLLSPLQHNHSVGETVVEVAPASTHRAVLYITGIASDGSCDTPWTLPGSDSDPGWLWISDPLKETGEIAYDDFVEYIYRDGNGDGYKAPDCSSSPDDPFPNYTFDRHDSCWSLDNSIDPDVGRALKSPPSGSGAPKGQAEKLRDFIKGYIQDHPRVQLSIIAHSQGGVLAAYTLAKYHSDPDIAKVSNLVTLDSPLQGIGWLAGTDFGIAQIRSWEWFLNCDGNDDKRYDSVWDMLPETLSPREVIRKITNPGNWTNATALYSVNEKGTECFGSTPFCMEMIPDSETRFGWELGHLCVTTGSHAKLANGRGDAGETQKVVQFIKQALLGPAPGANVGCQGPTPAPTINSLGCAPTSVQTGQTVTCNPSISGTVTSRSWSAPGGSPSSGSGSSFSASYGSAGSKTITLQACNGSACSSGSQTISVSSTPSYSADLTPDRGVGGTYTVGDTLTLCYHLNPQTPFHIRVFESVNGVPEHLVFEADDNGTGDCLPGTVDASDVGRDDFRAEFLVSGQLVTQATTYVFAQNATAYSLTASLEGIALGAPPNYPSSDHIFGSPFVLCYQLHQQTPFHLRLSRADADNANSPYFSVYQEWDDSGSGDCITLGDDLLYASTCSGEALKLEAFVSGSKVAEVGLVITSIPAAC